MNDYPTLMFRCPGSHFAPEGLTYDYVGVNSREELLARLNEGWSVTLGEAMAAVTTRRDEVAEPRVSINDDPHTREELEAKATELGIKFDGRTTDAALQRKIDAAGGE